MTSRPDPSEATQAPTLNSSSQVSAAPGRGVLPLISGHMAAGLSLYQLDAQPVEQLSSLISASIPARRAIDLREVDHEERRGGAGASSRQ